jgi:acyl-CoA thioester hydrolase
MSMTNLAAPTSPAPTLARCHHEHRVRVYWEDTDAGGIVFYGNYLKFMERARTEWFSALGFGQEQMRRDGEGMFIVAETQLRYLKPARLDDVLTVTVIVAEVGRATVTFKQEVWRDTTLLTEGQIRIGWVQAVASTDASPDQIKPARIPARILSALPEPIDPIASPRFHPSEVASA